MGDTAAAAEAKEESKQENTSRARRKLAPDMLTDAPEFEKNLRRCTAGKWKKNEGLLTALASMVSQGHVDENSSRLVMVLDATNYQRCCSSSAILFKCSMCNYVGERYYHAGKHFERVHVNNGKPMERKRKYDITVTRDSESSSIVSTNVVIHRKKMTVVRPAKKVAKIEIMPQRKPFILSLHPPPPPPEPSNECGSDSSDCEWGQKKKTKKAKMAKKPRREKKQQPECCFFCPMQRSGICPFHSKGKATAAAAAPAVAYIGDFHEGVKQWGEISKKLFAVEEDQEEGELGDNNDINRSSRNWGDWFFDGIEREEDNDSENCLFLGDETDGSSSSSCCELSSF